MIPFSSDFVVYLEAVKLPETAAKYRPRPRPQEPPEVTSKAAPRGKPRATPEQIEAALRRARERESPSSVPVPVGEGGPERAGGSLPSLSDSPEVRVVETVNGPAPVWYVSKGTPLPLVEDRKTSFGPKKKCGACLGYVIGPCLCEDLPQKYPKHPRCSGCGSANGKGTCFSGCPRKKNPLEGTPYDIQPQSLSKRGRAPGTTTRPVGPRKGPGDAPRNRAVTFYLSESERAELERIATLADRATATFTRSVILAFLQGDWGKLRALRETEPACPDNRETPLPQTGE